MASRPAPGPPVVVHLISSREGVGGAERVVAALSRSAQARGWQATVVNPFAASPDPEAFRCFYAPVPYRQCSTTGYLGLWATHRWAASALRQLRPDFVHVHLYHANVLAATMKMPPRAQWLLTHHHGALFEREGRRSADRLDRWATRRVGTAVAVSEAVRDHLVHACGLREQRVAVIRNGWSGSPVPATLSASPPTVVCVANFRPEKGHSVLLQAFQSALARVPGARLLLVGSGPLEAKARQEVRQRGLDQSVEFLGPSGDVWPVLARGDVFALASRYETLGLAVEEAMAAGLPVVATAVGGLREIVEPGRTGWLVAPGDHAGMADRLAHLLTDTAARRAFGARAAARAAHMTEAVMVDKYFEFYGSMTWRGER